MSVDNPSGRATIVYVITIVVIVVAVVLAAATVGDWFKAHKTVVDNTATAQKALKDALLATFGEPGRLDVRANLSVRAHISKKNYVRIPYPHRDKAIRTVGRAWCQAKEIRTGFLPRVLLYDRATGDELGCYGCDTDWVSRK